MRASYACGDTRIMCDVISLLMYVLHTYFFLYLRTYFSLYLYFQAVERGLQHGNHYSHFYPARSTDEEQVHVLRRQDTISTSSCTKLASFVHSSSRCLHDTFETPHKIHDVSQPKDGGPSLCDPNLKETCHSPFRHRWALQIFFL